MKEFITIHVGQAGIQMGEAAWELLCVEHGVKQDGSVLKKGLESRSSLLSSSGSTARECGQNDVRTKMSKRKELPEKGSKISVTNSLMDSMGGARPSRSLVDINLGSLFEDLTKGKVTPRAIFIDTDHTSIRALGERCRMLRPSQMISGRYDTAGLYSKGYLASETLVQKACVEISNMAARCDNLGGFVVFHSTGGGTGSGLTSALMPRLADLYGGKKSVVEICTGPTRRTVEMMRPSVTEPYNTVLSTHKSMNSSECAFLMDNTVIFDICRNKLQIASPTYQNMNRLIGQVVSSLTASSRYQDDTTVHLEDLAKHLIPLPRMKFLLASFSPLGLKNTIERGGAVNVTLLTKEAMNASNHLMSVNPRFGNYLACSLLYRGDVQQTEVKEAVKQVMGLGRFLDHCQPDFVVGISSQPAPLVPFGDIGRCPRSVVLLSNTTSAKQSWSSVLSDFNRMYKRRAYVHWYRADGMEVDEFLQAREDIARLVQEYTEFDDIVVERLKSLTRG